MQSTLTDKEIQDIYYDNKNLLWSGQQRALANAAAAKQHQMDIDLERKLLEELTQLWFDVLQRDQIVDKMSGILTDLLRIHSGNETEVKNIKAKYKDQQGK